MANKIIKNNVIYPELSYKVVGVLYNVHNELGRLYKEKQYCDAIEKQLKLRGIRYLRETALKPKNKVLPSDKADFIIENSLILEVKAKTILEKTDYLQVRRYLEVGDFKLGMLVNFRNRYIKPMRIINSRSVIRRFA